MQSHCSNFYFNGKKVQSLVNLPMSPNDTNNGVTSLYPLLYRSIHWAKHSERNSTNDNTLFRDAKEYKGSTYDFLNDLTCQLNSTIELRRFTFIMILYGEGIEHEVAGSNQNKDNGAV